MRDDDQLSRMRVHLTIVPRLCVRADRVTAPGAPCDPPTWGRAGVIGPRLGERVWLNCICVHVWCG